MKEEKTGPQDSSIESLLASWLSEIKIFTDVNIPRDVVLIKNIKGNMEQSFFTLAINEIVSMHEKKAHDYTSEGEFGNFEESARGADIEVYQAIENQIANKEARIRTIHRNNKNCRDVQNESLLDSYLDRAVYSIISYAYMLSRGNPVKMSPQEEAYYKGMQNQNVVPRSERTMLGHHEPIRDK